MQSMAMIAIGIRTMEERFIFWLTSRIRRRRAQDVADTTNRLRAVACIRFVRLGLVVCLLGGHAEIREGRSKCQEAGSLIIID